MSGRHKVFLGMAAGVGKTYRMLQEGTAEAENGRDVVIGYLEPHRRPDTAAQAAGLEVVARRRVVYRDVPLEEMDLPAILARAPELCLVDELAHTNAPGLAHPKRYDDVQDILAAGIDVFSTFNVQHLESLNDQVTELTGTRVRETLPDGVLGTADEVVLVDLTPEALIQRLRMGKVYPGERVETALNGFFKLENLAALREIALRQVAEDVETKRLTFATPAARDAGGMLESATPQAVGERLLALVKPTPKSQRVVRRAWRSAQRLQAELDILWVSQHEPDADERDQLEGLRRLATLLGAHLLVVRGDDVAETVRQVAADRGTTYVLIGTPKPRNAFRRLTQPALAFRLVQLLPGVDLRIVADRSRRTKEDFEVIWLFTLGLAVAAAVFAGLHVRDRRRLAQTMAAGPKRILFPFAGHALSRRALDAALRLAAAEHATLVPVFLARVPLQLPLDAPLPRACTEGLPLLETIEQRAAAAGVPVDSRVDRGRNLRHAMREAIAHERFDRIVVAAASARSEGLRSEDVAWLLDHAPGEVVIIRPGGDDRLTTARRRTSDEARTTRQPVAG